MNAAATLPAKPSLVPLATGVWFFWNANGMANAGVIEDEEGLTVIDALLTPAMALEFLHMVREVSGKPVRHVILTHFHGDHILGAQVFAGARIIAHENTRNYLVESGDAEVRRFASRPELVEPLAHARLCLPDVTFTSRLAFHSGRRAVELAWLGPAHTSGDVIISLPKTIVSVPEDGIFFVGDLLFNGVLPVLRSAYPAAWIETLRRLESHRGALVAPGHGPVCGAAELRVMRQLLEDLVGLVTAALDRGAVLEEVMAIEAPESVRAWPNQERWQVALRRAWEEASGQLVSPALAP